jgi:uncharacterized DUF497 family protein
VRYFQIIWDDDDDQEGNIAHIAEHGLTRDDVEYVIENPDDETTSHSSGRPAFFGYTPGGDYIVVVYDLVADDTIYPITAYEVPEP